MDGTMCTDRFCPARNNCYRQTATANPHRQSYADFRHSESSGMCDHFWNDEGYKITRMTKENHKQAKQELGFPIEGVER